MIENASIALSERVTLVTSDGRKRYDPYAKNALVLACLKPGVSVAAMALRNGINANLLRKWIQMHKQTLSNQATQGFVPVTITAPVAAQPAVVATRAFAANVQARLANGVQLDLGHVDSCDLGELLSLLSALPCSASTRN